MKKINVSELPEKGRELVAGETILLSGKVYCARDAAHKKLFEMMDKGTELPLDLNNAVIYYAGPTPAFGDKAIAPAPPIAQKYKALYFLIASTTSSDLFPFPIVAITPFAIKSGVNLSILEEVVGPHEPTALSPNAGVGPA